jgi:deoxyribodipyrimidine photo-lyase
MTSSIGFQSRPTVQVGAFDFCCSAWLQYCRRVAAVCVVPKSGASWFWQTLLDADLANNTQGWQWTAGTGVDAAPYFRVFNPARQGERFDPRGDYVRRWVPELAALPAKAIHAPWDRPAQTRRLAPAYPERPIVDLAESRQAALTAYRQRRAEPQPEV